MLPNEFAVLRFLSDCFDVRMPEMERMLQHIRRNENTTQGYFPARLNRVMLGSAEEGNSRYVAGLCTIAYRALHEKIRFIGRDAIWGEAAHVAEAVAIEFPRLYVEVVKGLDCGSIPERKVLDILVREVFVPTFFLKMASMRRRGNEDEWSIDSCWYLPKGTRGEREYPFQITAKNWLHAAGCRYPEDVGKRLNSPTKTRIVRNWLNGQNVPDSHDISSIVDRFKEETKRFGDPQEWKGRLVFAAGMQRLFQRMDSYFSKQTSNFSFQLSGLLKKVELECVPIDSDNVLAGQRTFFAARLIYRRIRETKEWKHDLAMISKQQHGEIEPAASTAEWEETRRKREHAMRPGNLLMKFIRREIPTDMAEQGVFRLSDPFTLPGKLFDLGVLELNRIITKEAGRN